MSSNFHLSRRQLLQTAGLAVSGLLLPTCGSTKAAAAPRVAITRAEDYTPSLIREQVAALIDQLGGLGDIVKSGDSVAIKVNLTGGTYFQSRLKQSATETYVTHPTVVRALVEALQAAKAGEIFIVESLYDRASYSLWGYEELEDDLGITLLDLNKPAPSRDFIEQRVGKDWLVYEQYFFNSLPLDVDVFMSVTKMKCHATAGLTLSMKNLVGLVPAQFYHLDPAHNHRSALHGPEQQGMTRIPSVIMDLVRTRPIDFSLIDGVGTSEGGEGPWNNGWHPHDAHVLIAGKNMVATDAVAAAVMGFDPQAASFAEEPFRYSLNHLQLANALGLGTNDLSAIEIAGEAIDDVRVRFRPYRPDAKSQHILPFGGYL